jgi:hypothetical protein
VEESGADRVSATAARFAGSRAEQQEGDPVHRLRCHLSYANVAATLALIIAIAGGTAAVAGTKKAPKNSVVAKSIKNGNVTAKKLGPTTLINASATISDPSPLDGTYVTGTAVAHCPTGSRAISGGGTASGGFLVTSAPDGTGSGWRIVAASDSPGQTLVNANVSCLLPTAGSPTEQR